MKPAYCQKHGATNHTITSPRLDDAIAQGGSFDQDKICVLQIESDKGLSEYLVDEEFLSKFALVPANKVVRLRDREKDLRRLNDRLLIRRIVKEMRWVCSVCLHELLQSNESTRK